MEKLFVKLHALKGVELPGKVIFFYSVSLPACPALGRDRGR